MKTKILKMTFDEPKMIDRVAVYGGINGKHLDIAIPETMATQTLNSWRERNFDRIYEVTRISE